MAAFRPDEMHSSASFVKIAAMYGAFELPRTMNQLSQEYGKAPKTAFLNAAAAHFRPLDPGGGQEDPLLKGLSEAHMFPGFSINYDATPDPNGVLGLTFNSEYDNSLLQMISLSDDTESAEVRSSAGLRVPERSAHIRRILRRQEERHLVGR